MILLSGECHQILPIRSRHRSGNDLGFRKWLGTVRQQAFTWTNVDPDLHRHMAPLGVNVFRVVVASSYGTPPIHSGNSFDHWLLIVTGHYFCLRVILRTYYITPTIASAWCYLSPMSMCKVYSSKGVVDKGDHLMLVLGYTVQKSAFVVMFKWHILTPKYIPLDFHCVD